MHIISTLNAYVLLRTHAHALNCKVWWAAVQSLSDSINSTLPTPVYSDPPKLISIQFDFIYTVLPLPLTEHVTEQKRTERTYIRTVRRELRNVPTVRTNSNRTELNWIVFNTKELTAPCHKHHQIYHFHSSLLLSSSFHSCPIKSSQVDWVDCLAAPHITWTSCSESKLALPIRVSSRYPLLYCTQCLFPIYLCDHHDRLHV